MTVVQGTQIAIELQRTSRRDAFLDFAAFAAYVVRTRASTMTFLNPLALIGLVAAAIPLVLHLLNLRRLRTIDFSSLTFIKELQRTRIRRLKLQQLLLLLIRTLLVVCIVLAFARPAVESGAGGLAPEAHATAVLMIDNSASMSVADKEGSLLSQARRAATAVVDGLRDGDDIFVLPMSDVKDPASSARTPFRNRAAARQAISEVTPSMVRTDLPEALQRAATASSTSHNLLTDLFLFSDFQRSLLETGSSPSRAVTTFPAGARAFLVGFGSGDFENLGIESVRIPTTIFESGRLFEIRATVHNHAATDRQNELVSVFLNGERVAQKSLDVPAGSTREAVFNVATPKPGFVEGFVELEPDDFESDNRRFFSLHIPNMLRVLLVGTPADLTYLRLALQTRQQGAYSLDVSDAAPDALLGLQMRQADVIIFADVASLTANQQSDLKEFLIAGGGILWFPGSSFRASSWNNDIAAPLGLPSVDSVWTRPGGAVPSSLRFSRVEYQHPLFQDMFQEEVLGRGRLSATQRQLESPEVVRAAVYHQRPSDVAIITLMDQIPFLLETRQGKGRSLCFCVSADDGWSDLPHKGLFVPLLHRAISYLAQEQVREPSGLAGTPVSLRIPDTPETGITVSTPRNVEYRLPAQPRGLYGFTPEDELGVYTVRVGKIVRSLFSTNLDPAESEMKKVAPALLHRALGEAGIQEDAVEHLTASTDLRAGVLSARHGSELWQVFLAAALLLAILELFIARSTRAASADVSAPSSPTSHD